MMMIQINLYRKIVYFIGSPSSCKSHLLGELIATPSHAHLSLSTCPLSYVPILTSPPPADLISHSD